MLCERCKMREANIQYTEVINGVKTEHNFCAQCASEMDFGHYSAIFDGEFPLGKLLSGLLGMEEAPQKQDKLQQIVCPTCGTGYEEFVQNSCFGCADCYGIFDVLIHDNIKQLQGSDCHKGKRPMYQGAEVIIEAPLKKISGEKRESDKDEQIRVLSLKLQEAVRQEDYESAAILRDQMKDLKEGKEANA